MFMYELNQWPESVYLDAEKGFMVAAIQAKVDLFLDSVRKEGPSPEAFSCKNLGKKLGGLWQANLKVNRLQIRVLYAPYRRKIVVFLIHKKTSKQEQERAYKLAMKRKAEVDPIMKKGGIISDGPTTLN